MSRVPAYVLEALGAFRAAQRIWSDLKRPTDEMLIGEREARWRAIDDARARYESDMASFAYAAAVYLEECGPGAPSE